MENVSTGVLEKNKEHYHIEIILIRLSSHEVSTRRGNYISWITVDLISYLYPNLDTGLAKNCW